MRAKHLHRRFYIQKNNVGLLGAIKQKENLATGANTRKTDRTKSRGLECRGRQRAEPFICLPYFAASPAMTAKIEECLCKKAITGVAIKRFFILFGCNITT
jgi:hypothetical protein